MKQRKVLARQQRRSKAYQEGLLARQKRGLTVHTGYHAPGSRKK